MNNEIVPKKENEIQNTTSSAMIQMAIQSGSDLSQVRELLALKKEFEADEARKAYAVSMAEAQSEMPIVIKDSFNKQTDSKYAKEEAISKTIKPVYTQKGFSLSFDTCDSPLENHIRVICYIQHSLGHTEKRHIDYPYDIAGIKGTVNKTPIHAYKSTISYARNTLTCMAFNVATGDDNDGNTSQEDPSYTFDVRKEVLAKANKKFKTANDFIAWRKANGFPESFKACTKSDLSNMLEAFDAK